jgi:arabidopsis histidine kinase 2/3/4 (cytokinin receptor)
MQKPPWPWLAITSSFGTLVIASLIGYIFYATVKRIAKVEDDYQAMMVLKKRAEAADVAKSQVISIIADYRFNKLKCHLLTPHMLSSHAVLGYRFT